uniref:Dentin sialophosphoprotein-like n=1 Tax=Hirondellea gigas TaxID=1518452 RepID=A0A2P2I437_9CRUS
MVVEGTPLSNGDNSHDDQMQGRLNQQSHPQQASSSVHGQPNNLVRPRSVDDLLNGSKLSAEISGSGSKNDPQEAALDDLAESEVFVGSEDEEEDEHLRSESQPTSLTISYHDEPRLPLHAVKEEVEAEEAEEAAMSLQMSTQSPSTHSITSISVPSTADLSLGISTNPQISNRMTGVLSTHPIMSQINPMNSMNSLNLLNNEITRLSQDSMINMSHSVEVSTIADINGKIRFGSNVINKMSKSVDILEDDPCDQVDSHVTLTNDAYIDNVPYTAPIGSNGIVQQEVDLTDGIPSLGDLSCSGVDEGVNLDHSPFSEGSPLSHSLASSVASNMSMDDTLSSRTDTSSFTDTQDTVVAIVQKIPCSRLTHKEPQSRISPRTGKPNNGKSSQTNSGNKSYYLSEPSPRTPECRRRGTGVASPRLDVNNKKIGTNSSRNSPRVSDKSIKTEEKKKLMKVPVHDRRNYRNNGTMGTTVASRSKVTDVDLTRKSRFDSKYDTKDSQLSEPKYGTSERKKKERTCKEYDFDNSTLGRRKKIQEKEPGSEIPRIWQSNDNKEIEKYGTLGRRKKVREAGDGREETQNGLTKENKETLDTYATLPRRKAKEMTARWREQNLQSHPEIHPTVPHINIQSSESSNRPLRRSRSIGKGESSRSISSYTNSNSSNFIRCTSRPSPRLSQINSPVASPRPAIATQTPRKERTIICLETAIQTALLGHEVAAAMRALARVRSQDERIDSRHKTEIVRDYPLPLPPKPKPTHCDAQLQVDVGWGVCSCGSRREAARSAESEELQRQLKEERHAKDEVQGELDRTSQKIKDMLNSMEGVEKEFNQRCDSLVVLESQLQHSTQHNSRLQDRLSQYEDYAITMRKDLASCQEHEQQLQQQVTELESESRELAEFMGSEKEALTECLREAEGETGRLRQLCEDRDTQIEHREQEAAVLARLAEERRSEIETLTGELSSLQGRTRDLMVCQGAQVSSAAVTLSNLAIRLQALTSRLVHDYSVTEEDLQNIVTPSESDSSASSSATTSPEHKTSPFVTRSLLGTLTGRGSSPRKSPASFIHALLHALRGGPHSTILPFRQVNERNQSNDGTESGDLATEGSSSEGSVSLVDQVSEVDVLLSRFLKVCCVLKNDSDSVLNEVQEENERLTQEVRSQQQLIEQEQSDYELLNRANTRAQRQLSGLARDKDKGSRGDVRRSQSMDCDSSMHDSGDLPNKMWSGRQYEVGSEKTSPGFQQQDEVSDIKAEGTSIPSVISSNPNLLLNALQTLDAMPKVMSSEPSLKNLYTSLNAHNATSQLSNGTQSRDAVKQNGTQPNLCSSNNGASISENYSNFTGNGIENSNSIANQVVSQNEAEVNGSSNLNVLSDSVNETCNNDHSNDNNSLPELGPTPSLNSLPAREELFDLNANPPSYLQTSNTDHRQALPLSLPGILEGHVMHSPSKKISPNGITSPHSPRVQKSPMSSTCSPHTSPMSDHVVMMMPGVMSPLPILVQTETHL